MTHQKQASLSVFEKILMFLAYVLFVTVVFAVTRDKHNKEALTEWLYAALLLIPLMRVLFIITKGNEIKSKEATLISEISAACSDQPVTNLELILRVAKDEAAYSDRISRR